MDIGLVTYKPEKVDGFSPHVYYVKRADGSIFDVAEGMYNDITCFADAKAIRRNSELVAVSHSGSALRKNKKMNLPWDFVCPTENNYREQVLNFIEKVGKNEVQGVILNLYHFPEEGFCVCDRCTQLKNQSGLDWTEWRTQIVTNFIKEAKGRVKGNFAVEIWPDPVLSKERFGIDLQQISNLIDFFHIPFSAHNYQTMYWVDMLTRIFIQKLTSPVYIELSAELLNDRKMNYLLKTVAHVSKHDVECILLLVHNSKNAEKIRNFAVNDTDFQKWVNEHGFQTMAQIIDSWKEFY